MSGKFLYFAYGSNLLAKRMNMNCPSAKRIDYGLLKDFKLDFNGTSVRWNGATATIVPMKESHVWGTIWEVDDTDRPHLDKQEAVHLKQYFAFDISVEAGNGIIMKCLSYQQCQLPTNCGDLKFLPDERKPSLIYLNTMIQGAEESNLPNDYISFLKSIPHNGYTGKVNLKNDP